MSTGLRSPKIEPVRSRRSSGTSLYATYESIELDSRRPLLLVPEKSSKKVRICTLCGRYEGCRMPRYLFIMLCITIAILILLLGAIILLYVIVPLIVRSAIAKAQLGFRSVNIEHIQNDSFRLRAQLELSNTGSIPATILAPLIIHVDNVGTVINNESISITGGSANSVVVPIDCPFVVSNLEAFHNFTRSLIFEPNVVWHLKAEATIQPISSYMLSYSNIPFNKEVKLTALNGLTDVSIDSINLNRSDEHRVLVDIIIKIRNPSVFSIDLGRLFFTLGYNNCSVGYAESNNDNITLHSGDNAIPFFGELESTTNESYNAISAIIKNFLTNRTTLVAASAGPNCTSYPLLAAGMTGLSLDAQMPPFDQQLIASLIFKSMSLIPSTRDRTVALSASIIIKINSPLGTQSPLYINTMDMRVSLLYRDNSVGTLNVLQVQVNRLDAITYESEFVDKSLILDGIGAGYEKFAQDFIKANETYPITFRIAGLASVVGSFALGPLNIDGIHVDNSVSLAGLNGLNNVHVDGISVPGEEGNALRLLINATIENSGITDVQLKNFSLYMADGKNNTVLGVVPIDVLAVKPGLNKVSLNGLIAPLYEKDLSVVGDFFSAYLNGQTQPVILFHNQSSGNNATALDLTVSGLSMKANLDGIQAKLIRQVNVFNFGIEFDSDDVNRVYITGRLSVLFELPSNVHMVFKAFTSSISFILRFNNGPPLGRIVLNNIPVQHNQTTNELLMSFQKQELIVLNSSAFEQFAAHLVLTTNVSVGIEGLASALAQIRIGNITLSNIPVTDTLQLAGYNQFDNGLLSVVNVDITGAVSSQALALQVRTKIINPSVVNLINGGRLLLDLCDTLNGTSLGLVNIDRFYLLPQGNDTIIDAQGIFNITEKNTVIARELISNMVSGIDSPVELRGTLEDNSTGTTIPLLSLAIAGLRIHTQLPGLSGDKVLVRELRLKRLTPLQIIEIPIGLVKVLSARIRLSNPFSTSMVVQDMNIRADSGAIVDENVQVGVVQDNTPLYIGAHAEVVSPYVNVTLTAKLATLAALIRPLLAGDLRLSLSGYITVKIGKIEDDFVLSQLPVTMLNVTADQEPAFQE